MPSKRRDLLANRARDWFDQALQDLDQAEDSRAAGRHEWACFATHQAAENAVKALHLHRGQEAWGHVIAKLLVELPEAVGRFYDTIMREAVWVWERSSEAEPMDEAGQ